MKHTAAADQLARLGPLDVSESKPAARMRLHQAWYRSDVLQLPRFGRLPAPSGRPLGSVLHPEDASNGANFTSAHGRSLYERRRAEGWGVDPTRCTSLMTSSQALTINVLSPLFQDLHWASSVFCRILEAPDCTVEGMWLEYAPARRSMFLRDSTRMDALVALREGADRRYVAIEVKLVDRFISRVLPLGEAYKELFSAVPIWQPGVIDRVSRSTNQLLRVHALAAAIGQQRQATRPASLLLLTHPIATDARTVSRLYLDLLADPGHLTHVSLATFVEAMSATASTAEDERACAALRERYVDLSPSDALWRQTKAAKGTPQSA